MTPLLDVHFKFLCYIMEDVADPDLRLPKNKLSTFFRFPLLGQISDTAALLGISRMTLYRYSDDYHSV